MVIIKKYHKKILIISKYCYLCIVIVIHNSITMKDSNKTVRKDPLQEARRYVDNARMVLQANGKLNVETGCYEDPKYVKAAGHYLWLSALMAVDTVFPVKDGKKKRKGPNARVTVGDYKSVISQRDAKLLALFMNVYHIAHLSMGYDGVQDREVCRSGFRWAEAFIERCATLLS